jgi:hypothetical protein
MYISVYTSLFIITLRDPLMPMCVMRMRVYTSHLRILGRARPKVREGVCMYRADMWSEVCVCVCVVALALHAIG